MQHHPNAASPVTGSHLFINPSIYPVMLFLKLRSLGVFVLTSDLNTPHVELLECYATTYQDGVAANVLDVPPDPMQMSP